MRSEAFTASLKAAAGAEHIFENEPMERHTSFRIGGPADYFVAPASPEALRNVLLAAREREVPVFIMGNGSNLLVSDSGYRGMVVQIGKEMNRIDTAGDAIEAQAGALLSVISRAALSEGLTGLEFAGGIPGSLGGACVMNAGAYDGEMRMTIRSARILDEDLNIRELSAEEMELGYRSSIFQRKKWIVLSARMELRRGDPEKIRERMEELRARRTSKQPLDLPSAGSTFKRPEGHFAGKLIMEAGLRGYRVGGASVSEKHCGFVVNDRHASASDVYRLIGDVRRIVADYSGITLEPEVRFLGEF